MLRRLSDPTWFQAFGCVLGFDWHSSGVTTTVCGALKDGLKGLEHDSGLRLRRRQGRHVAQDAGRAARGGRARAARATPSRSCTRARWRRRSTPPALQDGYQIYHHTFVSTLDGHWAVVQQGMHDADGTARRYHWLGEGVADFVVEPHAAVAAEARPSAEVLNLVADESGRRARRGRARWRARRPSASLRELRAADVAGAAAPPRGARSPTSGRRTSRKAFVATYETQPAGFEALLASPGVGPKTVRALTLISELVLRHPGLARATPPSSATRTAARTATRTPSTARPTTATSRSSRTRCAGEGRPHREARRVQAPVDARARGGVEAGAWTSSRSASCCSCRGRGLAVLGVLMWLGGHARARPPARATSASSAGTWGCFVPIVSSIVISVVLTLLLNLAAAALPESSHVLVPRLL